MRSKPAPLQQERYKIIFVVFYKQLKLKFTTVKGIIN